MYALGLVLSMASAIGLLARDPQVEIVNKSNFNIIYSTESQYFNIPNAASNKVLPAKEPGQPPAKLTFGTAKDFHFYYDFNPWMPRREDKDVAPGTYIKHVTFTPGKTAYVKFDRNGRLVPQRGPGFTRYLGAPRGVSQSGYSLAINVTHNDIKKRSSSYMRTAGRRA